MMMDEIMQIMNMVFGRQVDDEEDPFATISHTKTVWSKVFKTWWYRRGRLPLGPMV